MKAPWLLALAGLALAAVSALPHAGSWNDGSRLAAVESIADRHTLTIDDSIFCQIPSDLLVRSCLPYPSDRIDLLVHGTRDKLLIRGHFYSDKPAVISILMAGIYQVLKSVGLPPASERPDLFCWALTVATSGFSYLIALLALDYLGRLLKLPPRVHLAWIASFALATFSLTYTRHMNNHILLLAVVALVCVQVVRLALDKNEGFASVGRLAALGTLAGVGFNLDLGSGPLLVGGLFVLLCYRCRRPAPVLVFVLAACPWVLAGLGINYAIGGVWKPMNMVAEYSAWPGCPFGSHNLTGYARHGPFTFPAYALSLLVGKQGFFNHNLPVLLTLPALSLLVRRQTPFRPELLFSLGWCLVTWMAYAVLSNNHGGVCCSIRWFVAFLAPAYFLLAVFLREKPGYLLDFLVLSFWGGLLGMFMWRQGPWTPHVIFLLWPIVAAALVSWLVCHRIGHHRSPATEVLSVTRMRQIDRWLGTPVCFLLTRWRRCFGQSDPDPDEQPHRILFIKLAEQGSTVLAQGALREALYRVGRANVYFLLFAENRPVLDVLDLVPPENIITIPTGGLAQTFVGAFQALRSIRRERIDAVVDLEFFARSSAALAYLSGARWRVGYHAFGGEASYRGDLLTHRVSFNPYLHTSQAFHLLVEALDYPAQHFPTLDQNAPPVDESGVLIRPGLAEIEAVQSLLGRFAAKPLLLLNANASDLMPLRRWPGERYVELASRLLDAYPDVTIVFTGAPSEAEAVANLVRQVDSPRCISLAGQTTLRQLLVLYSLAEVMVTNDSGPAHFATLTPIDVVVVFGPETPRLFAARSPRTRALWAGLACSPCLNAFNNRNSACRDNVCMQRITVDEVFAEVRSRFEARQGSYRVALPIAPTMITPL
jgi:ADP-heptose:LPS heptosyltransferase